MEESLKPESEVGQEGVAGLEVSYGLDRNISRVKSAIKRIPWYAEQGYKVASIKLPTGLSENPTDEEIATAVQIEYSEKEYENFKVFIEERWEEFSKNFEKLKTALALNLRDKYVLVLTKYGMVGSYDAEKGEVIVNIKRNDREKTVGIIFHEVIHLTIEHLIKKYQIRHWYKERLVDLMMDKYFPGRLEGRSIKEDVTAVDEAFNKFFPDFEAVVRAIGENKK